VTDLSMSLLMKLGSIAVHAAEATSPGAHPADVAAIHGLISDPEVAEWLAAMDALSLLPVRR
jgi:hypothetical protein